jgi:long-subunit fatty acid transport protein
MRRKRELNLIIGGALGLALVSGSGKAATFNTPPTLILPNFDRTLVGQIQGLEAGAFTARANDSSSNWYNPAGLSRADRTSLNASSSAYGWTKVSADTDSQSVGETTTSAVPQFFGVVIASPIMHTEKLRVGFSLTQETAWTPVLQQQISNAIATGNQRLSYSIRDNFGVSLPGLAAGYHPDGPWRFGASLSLVSTNYLSDEYASEQQLGTTSQANQVRSSQVSASSVGLSLGLGAQYEFSDRWKAGLMIRSPSLTLWGSSKINYENLTSTGGVTTDANFYDPSARFRYRLPLAANLGIAYVANSFEVEGDLRYHAPVNTYSVFSSDQPITTSSNSGGAPTTTSQDFSDIQVAFRNVVDFSVGGKYSLSPSVDLHGGFYSSYSPMKDQGNAVFRKIDLYGITFGSSVTVKRVSGSLGAAYEFGSSDPYTVINSLTGTPFVTTIHVSTLKLLFALTIGF